MGRARSQTRSFLSLPRLPTGTEPEEVPQTRVLTRRPTQADVRCWHFSTSGDVRLKSAKRSKADTLSRFIRNELGARAAYFQTRREWPKLAAHGRAGVAGRSPPGRVPSRGASRPNRARGFPPVPAGGKGGGVPLVATPTKPVIRDRKAPPPLPPGLGSPSTARGNRPGSGQGRVFRGTPVPLSPETRRGLPLRTGTAGLG